MRPPCLVELADFGLELLPLFLRQPLEIGAGLEEILAERVGDFLLQVLQEFKLRGGGRVSGA